MFILDAHLDLSMNALDWNRDLTRPVSEIREREQGWKDKPDRATGTVSLEAMRRGQVGLCVATQIARYVKRKNRLPGWHSPAQAWAQTQGQWAWYRAMEEAGEMRQITNLSGLDQHLDEWLGPRDAAPAKGADRRASTGRAEADGGAKPRPRPVGYILSLEGADSILTMRHLERAHGQGLRAVGPAHYGPGTYAQGTDASGGLGSAGRELLKEMDRLGMILDATHLCDESFWEALDHFHGPVWASHSNCRVLVPHHRQFSDDQIKALIKRGAVIGAALDAWMLSPGWVKGKSTPAGEGVTLSNVAEHINHVCQIAGNARHAGIGSDLDGAFGREQSPADLDTIADLQKLVALLEARGFSTENIERVMHGNFVDFLRRAWGGK